MLKTYPKLFILLILFAISLIGRAQQNLTLFLMHDLPQANFVNPAVSAKCPKVIGFPGLASVHTNYSNTAFTLQELLANSNDSLKFNPGPAIDQMNGQELVAVETHYTPIYLGIWIKSSYLTFSISEKVLNYNTINSDAAELAWYGNKSFLGKEASLNGIRGNANHYREYALGLARQSNERFQFGIRAKLLFGKGNVYMPRTRGGIRTNERTFALDTDLESVVHSSFPLVVTTDDEGYVSDIAMQEDVDWMAYMMNRRNLGLGFDFGLIYELDEKTTLSASLLDMGLISWRRNVNTFESEGSFQYTGTDNTTDFNDPDYFNNLGDSLRRMFTPKPYSSSYISRLVPQLYLGATRKMTDHINTGLVLRNEIYRNKLHPSLTISANTYNYKVLNASISYSVINGSYSNIGAGIGAKIGAIHIHAVSDNLLSFSNLSNARNINLRFGISIIPACDPKEIKNVSNKNGIHALPCYYDPYTKRKRN